VERILMRVFVGAAAVLVDMFAPFKSATFMIKSISQSWHNAKTDIKTDMN
jgi:hypothetical protein